MPDLGKSTIDPDMSVFKCGPNITPWGIFHMPHSAQNLMGHGKKESEQEQQQQNLIPSKFIHQRGLSSSRSDFDASKSISADDY